MQGDRPQDHSPPGDLVIMSSLLALQDGVGSWCTRRTYWGLDPRYLTGVHDPWARAWSQDDLLCPDLSCSACRCFALVFPPPESDLSTTDAGGSAPLIKALKRKRPVVRGAEGRRASVGSLIAKKPPASAGKGRVL